LERTQREGEKTRTLEPRKGPSPFPMSQCFCSLLTLNQNKKIGLTAPAEADLLPPGLTVNTSDFSYFLCSGEGGDASNSSLCLVGSTLMYSFTVMSERQ
jgi:hypothetical protein